MTSEVKRREWLFGHPGDAEATFGDSSGETPEELAAATLQWGVREQALAKGSPRYSQLMQNPVPPLMPGDASLVRWMYLAGIGFRAERWGRGMARLRKNPELMKRVEADLGVGSLIVRAASSAVPYYMTTAAAQAVLGSHAPAKDLLDELRLPFPRVLLFFANPLVFGPATGWFTPNTRREDAEYQQIEEAMSDVLTAEELERRNARARHLESVDGFTTFGGSIGAFLLSADSEGRLRDSVVYFATAYLADNHDESTEDINAYIGSLRSGAFAPLAQNAAAVASWGAWTPPLTDELITPDLELSTIKDAINRGVFRRKEASGRFHGTHVIDVGRTNHGHTGHTHTGRTVTPHLRCGHWRRARCGPRYDWHYEGRWIGPVLVNADAATDDIKPAVYRLPEPPPDEDTGGDDIDLTEE